MVGEAKKESRKWLIVFICSTIVFAIAFFVLFIRGNYANKLLIKLGIKKQEIYVYQFDSKTVAGWDRCLTQLDTDADVVFIGDSITHQSDFTVYFPDKHICNLGIGSDTLAGMNNRVEMVKNVKPEKVFLLGGINSLKNDNFDVTYSEYGQLINNMISTLDSEIYVISVLPISRESEKNGCSNETIIQFNEKIKALAKEKGLVYIDLATRYLLDGAMNPAYTTDGVHLTKEAYDIWAEAISDFIK